MVGRKSPRMISPSKPAAGLRSGHNGSAENVRRASGEVVDHLIETW